MLIFCYYLALFDSNSIRVSLFACLHFYQLSMAYQTAAEYFLSYCRICVTTFYSKWSGSAVDLRVKKTIAFLRLELIYQVT